MRYKSKNLQQLFSLSSTVRQGTFSPCYIFCGEEEYFVRRAGTILENAFISQYPGLVPEIFFADEQNPEPGTKSSRDLLLESLSMGNMLFDQHRARLLLVKFGDSLIGNTFDHEAPDSAETKKRAGRRKKKNLGQDELVAILEKTSSAGRCLVVSALCAPVRQNPLVAYIYTHGTVLEFGPVRDYELGDLHTFIQSELLAPAKKTIGSAEFKKLADYVGLKTHDIADAIEKLILYTGERPAITARDVDAVCDYTKETGLYALQDSFAEGNQDEYVREINDLLKRGLRITDILRGINKRIIHLRQARDIIDREGTQFNRMKTLSRFDFMAYMNQLKEQYQPTGDHVLNKKPAFSAKIFIQAHAFARQELARMSVRLMHLDFDAKMSKPTAKGALYLLSLTAHGGVKKG